MRLEDLDVHGKGFWYLATPYTLFKRGRHNAFLHACEVAAKCMKRGVAIFSPIAHSHPLSDFGGIDETDLNFWLEQDQPLIDAAVGCLVCMLDGWRESSGVAYEIEEFRKAKKPYFFLDPQTLEIT